MSSAGLASTDNDGLVIDLHQDAATRILTQAARSSATILLQPKCGEQASVEVRLTEARMDALIAEPVVGRAESMTQTGCMDATLLLDRQEYLFSTNLLELIESEGQTFMVLARPNDVQTWQRRRFLRAEVAQSSTVQLTPVRPAGVPVTPVTGAVLNISPDGLACRLPVHEATSVPVGEICDARFELCGDREPIVMRATLRSKTPGGSQEHVILGIQFDTQANSTDVFDRLSRALRAYY